MTDEEAISVLEESKRQNEVMRDNPNTFFQTSDVEIGQKNAQKRIDALNMAISTLRAQQKSNDPLTPDELREMDGDKIYIHFIGACKGFYDDEYAPYYGQREQYIQKYNGMLRGCDLPLKYYGESWLAYRRKPEEVTK